MRLRWVTSASSGPAELLLRVPKPPRAAGDGSSGGAGKDPRELPEPSAAVPADAN